MGADSTADSHSRTYRYRYLYGSARMGQYGWADGTVSDRCCVLLADYM
jgi:hypothetical protein